jgi:hypothetical protein
MVGETSKAPTDLEHQTNWNRIGNPLVCFVQQRRASIHDHLDAKRRLATGYQRAESHQRCFFSFRFFERYGKIF